MRKLGEGGMGTVWLGEHTLLGRRAAVKVLLPEYTSNEAIVQRFFNEARAATAIADPGIVQVFDFGNANGSAYIVMELLEGEAMDARLRRIGRFAPADATRLMAQIATSLGAAHARGVIHRDLKPENIYIVGDPAVTGGERTKILDFGIAKLAGEDAGKHKTRTGLVMGTPVYMSPEQCRGASTIDGRSDIYALGCVLFTMLCGRPPFESEGTGDLIIMHVRDTPPAPSSLVPGLVPEIDAFMARCLEKDPNRRFQTTAELVKGLAAVEAALYGTSDDEFADALDAPTVLGTGSATAAPTRVSSPGYRPRVTPAAALAYRQQHTPAPHDARTRLATPTGGLPEPTKPLTTPTTLGSAAVAVQTTAPRRTGLLAGIAVGVLALGGGAFALLGSRSHATVAQPAAAPSPSSSAPVPAPPPTPEPAPTPPPATPPPANTAAATPPSNTAATTTPPADTAATTPPSNTAAATTPPTEPTTPPATPETAAANPVSTPTAAVPGGTRVKRRPPKTNNNGAKQGGSNASSTGSGRIDRGD